MNSVTKKGLSALVAAATLATVATPAEARPWRDRHRGDDAALAIGAGLLGLGIGAAIASDRRGRYYDPYHDRRYYSRGYYGGGYYDRGYYRPDYRRAHYRGYGRDCFTRRVWDPYLGRRVRVRYCY